MSAPLPRIERVALGAWMLRLFDQIHETNLAWLQPLEKACRQHLGVHLLDLVPSYTTLLVEFDPLRTDPQWMAQQLKNLLSQVEAETDTPSGQLHELPVWYDPRVGPDLLPLSQTLGLDWPALAEQHAQTRYRVFALGFAPGFAFMGSLPPHLRFPRLATPRPLVPVGSVAIAEEQTAIYPSATPGGWHLLGRTPLPLFDLQADPPSRFRVGDHVVFIPIQREEFIRLGGDPTPVGPT